MSSPTPKFPLFPLFPLLPTKLRLQILTHALPSPRLISFYSASTSASTTPSTTPDPQLQITKTSQPFPYPGLLHVNTESRTLALRHYVLYTLPSKPHLSQKYVVRKTKNGGEGGTDEEEEEACVYWSFELDIALYTAPSVRSRSTPSWGVMPGSTYRPPAPAPQHLLRLPSHPEPLRVKNVCLAPELMDEWEYIMRHCLGWEYGAFFSGLMKSFPDVRRVYGLRGKEGGYRIELLQEEKGV